MKVAASAAACYLHRGYPCVEMDGRVIVYSPATRTLAVTRKEGLDGLIRSASTLARYGQAGRHGNTAPGTIAFICTSDCLQRCIYCFNNGGRAKDYLDPARAIRHLERFVRDDGQPLVVKFFGGEPTMHMPFIKAVWDHCATIKMSAAFSVVTGGYISSNDLAWMIERHFAFTVSADGPDDIQERQRPLAGRHPELLTPADTIRRLAEEKCDFKVRVTATAENTFRLREVTEYFIALGAEIIHIEPVTMSGRAKNGMVKRPDAEEFAFHLMEAVDAAASRGRVIINSAYMKLLDNGVSYCQSGERQLVVGPRGELSRCYEAIEGCDLSLQPLIAEKGGNEGELPPATACSSLQHPAEMPEECRNCYARHACEGGCPSRNLSDSGDLWNCGGYFCSITRILFPLIMRRLAVAAELLEP